MTYRIRVKRPNWDDITAAEPFYSVVTVTSVEATNLKVLDTSGSDSRIDVMDALANIKQIAGESLPAMTSLKIMGVDAQSGTDQIDTTLFPDYDIYRELCLFCTIGADRYCFGLTNNSADCF